MSSSIVHDSVVNVKFLFKANIIVLKTFFSISTSILVILFAMVLQNNINNNTLFRLSLFVICIKQFSGTLFEK